MQINNRLLKILLCLFVFFILLVLGFCSKKLNPEIHSFDVTCTSILNMLTVGILVVYLNHTHNEQIHKISVLCETIDKIQDYYTKVQDIIIRANNDDKQVREAVYVLKRAYGLEDNLFESIKKINSSSTVTKHIAEVRKKHQELRDYVDLFPETAEETNKYQDIKVHNCVDEIFNSLMIIKFNL